MRTPFLLLSLLLLSACRSSSQEEVLVSMQVLDRNGFSETISNPSRLASYGKTDFLTPQPYEKILRVFAKNGEGKTPAKITSYHPNGQIWQYLEVIGGRAHGRYEEWHPNGRLKIQATVMEGMADLAAAKQASWLFDEEAFVWDEEGKLVSHMLYEKGVLEGPSKLFYSSGSLKRITPYHKDQIEGTLQEWSKEGRVLLTAEYKEGLREGKRCSYWETGALQSEENYRADRLVHGLYWDPSGRAIGGVEHGEGTQALFVDQRLNALVPIAEGEPYGTVHEFGESGELIRDYALRKGQLHGEETLYFPAAADSTPRPRLLLTWREDQLHGSVKTWYSNGVLESQKELVDNVKHGLSLAWYRSGALMLIEEYEKGQLKEGTYFADGEEHPMSRIVEGCGLATLYDGQGSLLRTVPYEQGRPCLD